MINRSNRLRGAAATAVISAILAVGSAHAEDMVGYVSPVAVQPSEQQITMGIEYAVGEVGWDARILDANLSPDRQISHVDTLITLGAKAIAAWSLDPNAVAGAYTRAQQQGIPVIGLNSLGEGLSNTVWWEIDTCEPGGVYNEHAAWIAERKPGARVIVFGGPPVEALINNVNCFMAAANAAGLEIVNQTDNTRDNTATAATLAADVITKYPDVDAVWAYNDSTALGASAALAAAGKTVYSSKNPDGVMVFGINANTEAIEAIKAGLMTGTWDPNNVATGIALVLAMKSALADPDKQQEPLTVTSVFYTEDNVDDWVNPSNRTYTLESIPLK